MLYLCDKNVTRTLNHTMKMQLVHVAVSCGGATNLHPWGAASLAAH